MRVDEVRERAMWSYVSDEERIPADHPLREMRKLVDPILADLSPLFAKLYHKHGRPAVPPEYLLRALLLQMLYTIRSERMLVEQLRYNILFRWFVGLTMDDEVWHATTFTKNRRRFIEGDIAREFFSRVVALARVKKLMSDEHFTVDGTMLDAAASHKSLAPRENDESAENRNGLIVDARLTQATGTGERAAAVAMTATLDRHGVTVGADKGYDVGSFVEMLALFWAIPHVARNMAERRSAISEATAATDGYACSQRKRKLVEECFVWMKTHGLLRKLRHRGLPNVGWIFLFTAAAYNLIRIRNLSSACA